VFGRYPGTGVGSVKLTNVKSIKPPACSPKAISRSEAILSYPLAAEKNQASGIVSMLTGISETTVSDKYWEAKPSDLVAANALVCAQFLDYETSEVIQWTDHEYHHQEI
jgi:hypothetical protein